MPVGWETHSSPDLGAPAQEQINERILEHCDLLIAVFWTRLGTPTSPITCTLCMPGAEDAVVLLVAVMLVLEPPVMFVVVS